MAPFRDDSDSDEAPEAFTLSQTKGVAKKRNAALRELEAAEKQKQKTKNRERDRKLKEQASQSVKRRKVDVEEEENDDESGGELDSGVEARMLRAMQQADEEESDVDVESGGENDEEDEDEEEEEEEESDLDVEGGSENEKDSNDDEEEDAEMEEAFDEVMDDVPSKANRLPDHLFTSTFTSKPTKDPLASSKITQQKKENTPQTIWKCSKGYHYWLSYCADAVTHWRSSQSVCSDGSFRQSQKIPR